jgi:hypothetical protein
MSRLRSGSGTSGRRGLATVALACLVVAGCSSSDKDAQSTPAAAAADWRNTTYTVTCDGVVPGGFRAAVVDGSADVPADSSRPPYYDHYEVRVAAMASGDVDGEGGADTVVLLECSPQPSNGIVQEVQLFSSTGRLLGTLPSPRTLREGTQIPPVYDPAGLSVQDGEIVAAMKAYGPDDFHASGPSVPLTVRWRFDGEGFVRAST